MNAERTMELLRIMAAIDDHEMCIWHPQADGTIEFHVLCNDMFWWATADSEPIETDDDLALLRQCHADLTVLEQGQGPLDPDGVATAYTADLYCARHRGMRPQRPYSKSWSPSMLALFDAAGPERTRESEG